MSATFWMERAVALARRAGAATAPNPPVGAVLTRDGRLLGEGWHRGPGRPHAEIEALADARRRGNDVRGATLWASLEPCCHTGGGKRTPPCVPALVQAGVARVRAAVPDPNPAVAGRGLAALAAAGLDAAWGPCAEAGAELIAPFRAWILGRRPFGTLKWAQSLDGRLGLDPPLGPWISSPAARAAAMELRAAHDAVAVGAGTLRADNPRLTLRPAGGAWQASAAAQTGAAERDGVAAGQLGAARQAGAADLDGAAALQGGAAGAAAAQTSATELDGAAAPRLRRLVFAGAEALPETARLFTDEQRSDSWLVVRPGSPAAAQAPRLCPGRVLEWDGADWAALGQTLLDAGFYRILVEGGPRLLGAWLAGGAWDRAAIFVAPRLLGNAPGGGVLAAPADLRLARPRWRSVGGDLLLEGDKWEEPCLPD